MPGAWTGTSSSSPRTTVVFRPGAASSGQYLGTMAEVAAAALACDGNIAIGFASDYSGAHPRNCAIAADTAIELHGRGELFAATDGSAGFVGSTVKLVVADGGYFKNPGMIKGLLITAGAITVSYLQYDLGLPCVFYDGASVTLGDVGSGASPISIAQDTTLILRRAGLACLIDKGIVAIGDNNLIVRAYDQSTITGNLAGTAGSGTVTYHADPSSTIDPGVSVIGGFTGTFVKVRAGKQSGIEPAGGATGSRPSSTAQRGQMYFDTSLGATGKPVWWDGTQWVDATGAPA